MKNLTIGGHSYLFTPLFFKNKINSASKIVCDIETKIFAKEK